MLNKLLLLIAILSLAGATANARTLDVYFIDVEGGQATLFVTPARQSLLIDTGWGYNAYRDANRIIAAAKLAKIKKIDYVLITHYHSDHVGGVPQLIAKMPVGTFIEHGPNREDTNATNHLVEEYKTATASVPHITVAPGGDKRDVPPWVDHSAVGPLADRKPRNLAPVRR